MSKLTKWEEHLKMEQDIARLLRCEFLRSISHMTATEAEQAIGRDRSSIVRDTQNHGIPLKDGRIVPKVPPPPTVADVLTSSEMGRYRILTGQMGKSSVQALRTILTARTMVAAE